MITAVCCEEVGAVNLLATATGDAADTVVVAGSVAVLRLLLLRLCMGVLTCG